MDSINYALEKFSAHYRLDFVKAAVAEQGLRAFTPTARMRRNPRQGVSGTGSNSTGARRTHRDGIAPTVAVAAPYPFKK